MPNALSLLELKYIELLLAKEGAEYNYFLHPLSLSLSTIFPLVLFSSLYPLCLTQFISFPPNT